GCPDADGDKIIDKKDSCPDAAGLAELNGCPDADGDRIIDKLDSCPDIAGVAALLGCPDADGDGVSDTKDKCPNEKGSLAAHGCPDKDADGIIDSEDRCPEVAGIIEKEGCPPAKLYLLDRQGNIIATAVMDKDGKFNFTNLDMDENTLFKLESYDVLISNEFVISNGKSVYVVRKGADGYFHYENIDADANKMGLMNEVDIPIQLNKKDAEKVKQAMDELVFDSGKDIIRPSSIEGLDVLADLLKQNPTWKLKLSGHTDNTSSLKFNMSLSKKRVEAVRNYLVKKGIETQRVVLKWYGPTKPIAPNTTEEGKQQNRRVEFMIIR
ncbi:MAG TPA: OmpA family protein, partial [Bacteroidia bacterium]|nr:OmpA family protein [Bacteroidia bacterium]